MLREMNGLFDMLQEMNMLLFNFSCNRTSKDDYGEAVPAQNTLFGTSVDSIS
jgi:hypothetical protein